MKFNKTLTAVAVAASIGISAPVVAQESKGTITGTSVSASTDQALAGVEVTIVNLETGLTRTLVTDSDGRYTFPLLPPGNYSLTAKRDGFSIAQEKQFSVRPSGKTNLDVALEAGDVERISVRGTSISNIDVTSSESQLYVDQEFIAKVPVPRDISSVALLAPGTVSGDSDFGNYASFGGSSVGENVYYVNGINVTNFRNGLGGSELPFEMYESFEVKTGGYSAEFGRSTGGVINARTKSGSNEFKWGASAYYEPAALRAHQPDVFYRTQEDADEAGTAYYVVNKEDETGETNVNLWASGALIEDKLFFFGLVNQKVRQRDYAETATTYDREGNDTLLSAKLDWYITPEHILEITAWDNTEELESEKFLYSPDSNNVGSSLGEYTLERGGTTWGAQYTGIITDDLTVSAQYSVNKTSYSNLNDGANPLGDAPVIYDRFTNIEYGAYGLTTPSVQEDKRTAIRFDVEWYVNADHVLKVGIDNEDLEAYENTSRAGGVAYRYENCGANLDQPGNEDCQVRQEFYVNQGDFETKSFAYYIEDTWTVTDNITARIGLRNETFENFNKAGEKFVDVSDQWAPRLGLSWDIKGDGESKVFANYGRYYLPVATNTNIRLAGDELYTRQFFDVESINDDFTPVLGEATGSLTVYSDGTLKGTTETVNADLDPMYQDEYILGYEQVINDSWSFGIKGTYRDLISSLEDIAIDAGFDDYIQQEFGSSCTLCSGFHYYVLTNPGNDVTITTDPDGDGDVPFGTYTIPADMLGYPEAERQYAAVDLTVDRAWDDLWMMSFTYTWSHSWGNTEGAVRSDNDQTDSGLTTNFDQPGLLDGAYGNLPNDRRHAVKVTGAYQVFENFTLGANFRWTSGRPLNSFGYHPTDLFASYYDAESFVKDGELVSRGSEGRTPSTWTLDLSAKYLIELEQADVALRADIFNLFNNDDATQLNEINERYAGQSDEGIFLGEYNPSYGLPTSFQTPRYVRFSVEVNF
ncbi:TonB-dependent receptor [Alteromonas sp. BL110]|uniref:TonB-dependent receptor n=1 Tax=Alteromonas sp. BL110 TaxID=1714845 RepID=UPI000E4D6AB3|nr:TonB-dependent receptor [Alteromonas sp. BL110]AXT37613.1 TonB-dependent receptor [Alteromonas sp. BL110]RKM80351.1 TonB-dependent receptor [Alteromonas sp. BL110]